MPRKGENRTERLNIRLTKAEMEQLRRDADTAAVDISALARAQLLNAAIPRRKYRRSADHGLLGEVLKHAHKIGGNLNQIAKVANSNGDLTHYREAKRTRELVEEIRDMVRAALTP